MKCLVVVAHPDDETIWMGGYILKNKEDWEIISLCRKNDTDRNPKFFRVCGELNASCSMSDLDDETMRELETEEVIFKIRTIIKSKEYDYIFTHGRNGEYGHKRHIDVHNAVNKIISAGEIKCKKIFYFSYLGENVPGKFCNVNPSANKFIKLPRNIYEIKKHLIKDVYGFNEDSFEVKSAGPIEAFDIK